MSVIWVNLVRPTQKVNRNIMVDKRVDKSDLEGFFKEVLGPEADDQEFYIIVKPQSGVAGRKFNHYTLRHGDTVFLLETKDIWTLLTNASLPSEVVNLFKG